MVSRFSPFSRCLTTSGRKSKHGPGNRSLPPEARTPTATSNQRTVLSVPEQPALAPSPAK